MATSYHKFARTLGLTWKNSSQQQPEEKGTTSMATEFKLPDLGEGVESADVAQINVSKGDEIKADQHVMELETEKAIADLPCPDAGKITEILVSAGDTVKVGQTLMMIEKTDAEPSSEADDYRHESDSLHAVTNSASARNPKASSTAGHS